MPAAAGLRTEMSTVPTVQNIINYEARLAITLCIYLCMYVQ